jgi:hypothetical protein
VNLIPKAKTNTEDGQETVTVFLFLFFLHMFHALESTERRFAGIVGSRFLSRFRLSIFHVSRPESLFCFVFLLFSKRKQESQYKIELNKITRG